MVNLCQPLIYGRGRIVLACKYCKLKWPVCVVTFSVVILVYTNISISATQASLIKIMKIKDKFLETHVGEPTSDGLQAVQYSDSTRKYADATTKEITGNRSPVVKEIEIKGWEKGVDRDPKKYVAPFKDTTIISGREICDGQKNESYFVVTVYTTPSKFYSRALIRQSWKGSSGVKIGFIVGLATEQSVQIALEQEAAKFKDIIQENMTESYNNLTIKSIALLKWFLRYCPRSTFLMKTDDDIFSGARVERFARELADYRPQGILYGRVLINKPPFRDPTHKWYVPKYIYPNDTYPIYLKGEGYAMSRDVVAKLYNASLDTPIINMEDIYITGYTNISIPARRVSMAKIMKMKDKFLEIHWRGANDGGLQTVKYSNTNKFKAITRRQSMPKETEIKGWEKGVDRDPKKYIDPFKDTTIISGREICSGQKDEAYFVTIIYTAPSNFKRRSQIRQNWKGIQNVKIGFIVGLADHQSDQLALEKEAVQFKDIIQENMTDSYNNLTIKSIALLKWFLRNCPRSKVLLKTDDDTYDIYVRPLTANLAGYPPRRILYGRVLQNRSPYRDPWHKWYVPRYIYPNDSYPTYLSGEGYAMSRDVVAKLYNASLDTPIINMEDIYITGICARKARVRPFGFYG